MEQRLYFLFLFYGREKKGAFGTYSPVSAENLNTAFTNDDEVTAYLGVDEKFNFQVKRVLLYIGQVQ